MKKARDYNIYKKPIEPKDCKRRDFLSCGRNFIATYKGNFVCNQCKETETWSAGINDY